MGKISKICLSSLLFAFITLFTSNIAKAEEVTVPPTQILASTISNGTAVVGTKAFKSLDLPSIMEASKTIPVEGKNSIYVKNGPDWIDFAVDANGDNLLGDVANGTFSLTEATNGVLSNIAANNKTFDATANVQATIFRKAVSPAASMWNTNSSKLTVFLSRMYYTLSGTDAVTTVAKAVLNSLQDGDIFTITNGVVTKVGHVGQSAPTPTGPTVNATPSAGSTYANAHWAITASSDASLTIPTPWTVAKVFDKPSNVSFTSNIIIVPSAVSDFTAVAKLTNGDQTVLIEISKTAGVTPTKILPTVTTSTTSAIAVSERKLDEIGGVITSTFNIAGRTPVGVTVTKGTETYPSARVIVVQQDGSPVPAGLQLLAEDNGIWYNTAVVGRGPAEGFTLADATTPVYIVANTPGTYNLVVKLVDATDSTKVFAQSQVLTIKAQDPPGVTTDKENYSVTVSYMAGMTFITVTPHSGATINSLSFKGNQFVKQPNGNWRLALNDTQYIQDILNGMTNTRIMMSNEELLQDRQFLDKMILNIVVE